MKGSRRKYKIRRRCFVHDDEWDDLTPSYHPDGPVNRSPPRYRKRWSSRSRSRSRSRSQTPRAWDGSEERTAGPSSSSQVPTLSSRITDHPAPSSSRAPPTQPPPIRTASLGGMSSAYSPTSAQSGSSRILSGNIVTSPNSAPTEPKAFRAFQSAHKSTNPQSNSPATPIQMHHGEASSSLQPAPPPPPNHSPPMQPPQPLPDVPDVMMVPAESQPADRKTEDKKEFWEKRTASIAKSTRLLEKVKELDKSCKDADHVLQSSFFAGLPEPERARLREQYQSLLTARKDAEKEYHAIRQELANADAWPTGPSATFQAEEDVLAKQKEISTYLKELATMMQEVQKVFGELPKYNPPALLSQGAGADEDGTAMDVDVKPESSQAGRKRRRMDDAGRADADGPSAEEMQEFITTLTDLEEKISTLRNDMTARDAETREDLENLISTRIDENNFKNAEIAREREEKLQEEEKTRNNLLGALTTEVQKAGDDIGEIATAVGGLVLRVADLEVELSKEKEAHETALSRLAVVEERLSQYGKSQAEYTRNIDTLTAALEAYKTSPPTPPVTPRNPSAAYVISVIEERILAGLHSTMVPFVEELRRDMENLLSEKNREVYRVVWDKLGKTMKLIEKIKARVDAGVSGEGVARGPNQA
ncbi:hypothetical protein JR316_0003987 [Psilocybe cubensis]|uniref:Uncharacterized protein n=1 Tax=Psilocybe cubensis TaxID=181762 RepID=A0ACB8HBH6_PSICU|nr:hypothetical protein JR316_0003987 [Psilocybe cubensis]KAH9484505.1 hypothetical protein JR316_0003987 [Psilocybe cubensis]